jgi:alkylation response protein AidB-like acyl-CoA dehydrogenase
VAVLRRCYTVGDVSEAVATARKLADDLLFPDATRVDGMDKLPAAHIDALAAAGLYGAIAPMEAGGLALALPDLAAVAEELASGCLATTFVWIQHFGLLGTLAYGGVSDALREQWLGPAIKGTLRGGIALIGQIPGPPALRAAPGPDGGWRLDGSAPWVTGWDGLVDVVLVAARGPDDTIVRLIMDAGEAPGLTVTRQRLIAVNASVTVRLDFDGVTVPAGRFVGQEPFDPGISLRPEGLRVNGSLALGVARRCCRLLGPTALDDQLDACRAGLDVAASADSAAMAVARAAACELAVRASAALAVHEGSKAVTPDQHAQRLSREALFLLVFGSRPPIKAELLRRLAGIPASW